jgi:hypothetical protein
MALQLPMPLRSDRHLQGVENRTAFPHFSVHLTSPGSNPLLHPAVSVSKCPACVTEGSLGPRRVIARPRGWVIQLRTNSHTMLTSLRIVIPECTPFAFLQSRSQRVFADAPRDSVIVNGLTMMHRGAIIVRYSTPYGLRLDKLSAPLMWLLCSVEPDGSFQSSFHRLG